MFVHDVLSFVRPHRKEQAFALGHSKSQCDSDFKIAGYREFTLENLNLTLVSIPNYLQEKLIIR